MEIYTHRDYIEFALSNLIAYVLFQVNDFLICKPSEKKNALGTGFLH